MKSALRMLSCGAVLLATSIFGSAGANAQQTVTITGCTSLTSVTSAGNITINCSATPKSQGGPSCTSLSVTPADDTNKPANITLTANCTAGTSPINSYTFTGPGMNRSQTGTSLVVTAPTVTTTYSVTASDGTSPSNTVSGSYTVGGANPGTGVDLSACTAQGYTATLMDLAYSTSGNVRLASNTLGNSNALVLRFTTPAAAGDTSSIQFSALGMAPKAYRVATVSTQPCSGSILASKTSQTPVFSFSIGFTPPRVGLTPPPITLATGTTYYITVVNRNADGSNSCTTSSCPVNMDFTN
jgi:hypothetical protein